MKDFAPPDHHEAFLVENDGVYFEGNTSSFLEREIYLFGKYERDEIELFISFIPSDRRGVILDVGANIGTHALYFANNFKHVHSFEPNAAVWPNFKRNVAINGRSNIQLHQFGLGENTANQPFFSIDKNNHGLGTFSDIEQYDMPLRQVGVFRVENGDDFIESASINDVAAVKIDVQGFEPEVLVGLRKTLNKFRPIVWFEYGSGTQEKIAYLSDVSKLFPYPITLWRLARKVSIFSYALTKERVGRDVVLPISDYIAVPV